MKIMKNKKGILFTRPRDTLSFFVGFFVTVLGVIPLLRQWGISLGGVVDFLAPFLENIGVEIFIWLVAIFGAYVVIDGFIEPPAHKLHWLLILAGLLLLATGLIPLLSQYGYISFALPVIGSNLFIYRIILTVEGLALMIGGLTEH